MASFPIACLDLDDAAAVARFREFVRENYRPNHVLADLAFLRWQFVTPWEPGPSGLFVIRGGAGQVLAHNAGVACEFACRGAVRPGRLSMSLMSVPRVRGFGLGLALVRHVADLGAVTLALAMNDESLRLHGGLGFRTVPRLHRYLFVPDAARFAPLLAPGARCPAFAAPPAPAAPSEDFAGAFTAEFAELFDRTVGAHRWAVRRSAAYLDWRYRAMPYYRYQCLVRRDATGKLAGVLVYRLDATEPTGLVAARVVELFGDAPALPALLADLVHRCRAAGVAFVDAFFAAEAEGAVLRGAGFVPAAGDHERLVPHWTHPLAHGDNPLAYRMNFAMHATAGTPDESWRDPEAWYVTKSDADQDRPAYAPAPEPRDG